MLQLIKNDRSKAECKVELPGAAEHHQILLDNFWQSHKIRNHSENTISQEKRFIQGWFYSHGNEWRPLYTWEAMQPIVGRKFITNYGKTLIESGVANSTIRKYLGYLKGYFDFILQHPYIHTPEGYLRLTDLYGPLEQPVSEFDIPQNSYSGERKGLPFDPELLCHFYQIVRDHYLGKDVYRHVRARDYAMMVLAGESGLRPDELIHLEISKDIFFDSRKIQTRSAKGANGSGKKARITLFTPLARDTLQFYLRHHRPHIKNIKNTDYLFPSKTGKMMTYSSMQKALQNVIAVAGKHGMKIADNMGWHWFRRFFATRFIEKFPGQMSVLISLLGHSSASTVHHYIHHSSAWMDQRIQEVLEGVDYHGH